MEKPQTHPMFFNPKELGRSLKEVATDLIKTESHEVVSRWFHAADDLDLFIWSDNNKNIIKQQLSFHGQIVEWNLIEGVKTGFVYEDESLAGGGQTQSELVRYDESLQKRTLEQALEIIGFTEALSGLEKKAVIENFLRDPSLGNLSPEAFLQKYKRMELPKAAPTSFFKSLLSSIGRWFK